MFGIRLVYLTKVLRVSIRARSACGIIAEEENRTSKTAPTQMLGGKYGIEWN